MAVGIGRRQFLSALGGVATAWPLVARAQQPKMPVIGFLGPNLFPVWTAAFVARLRELGWIEGKTVTIEYRSAEGRPERFAEFAAEFVQQNVDVIVAFGGAIPAFKRATSTIPIVFAVATDPVGTGLVASLARPGGNVTGLSSEGADTAGKRLALLRQVVPGLHRLAILFNAGSPAAVNESGEVQAAARVLSIDVLPLEMRRAQDIAPALTALNGKADALYIVIESLANSNSTGIITLAAGARLPTISTDRAYPQAGALMSYGPNIVDLYRHAGDIVDKILRGTKPGDIPVEQPTKFELVVNLTTAKAIGLTIPGSFLALADDVIE
jgi:putative tryptophan/tyrosine transport system substrate-binding protein